MHSDDEEMDGEEAEDKSKAASEKTTALPVLDLLQLVREAVGFAAEGDGSEGLDARGVWSDLVQASLPFLRCAALFYHFLTNCQTPSALNDDYLEPEVEFKLIAR